MKFKRVQIRTIRLLPLLLAWVVISCDDIVYTEVGNGEVTTSIREVDDFDEIQISGNYEVRLAPSNENKVTIETDENLHELIRTTVHGDRLIVESEGRLKSHEGILVTINYQEIRDLYISGAAFLTNEGVIRADELTLTMSGAGATDINIDTEKLIVDLTGAGSVKIRGKADVQRINLTGAGSFEAFDLTSYKAYVSISGVGGAQVNANEVLEANVSGVGGITYRGDPKVHKNISGLGKIESQSHHGEN